MTEIRSSKPVSSTVKTEGIIDKFNKLMAGSEPKIVVSSILKDLKAHPSVALIRKGHNMSAYSKDFPLKGQDELMKIVQRGLIKLGLLHVASSKEQLDENGDLVNTKGEHVNTKEKFWWTKSEANGGVAWGWYGPKTQRAVMELQRMSNIYDGDDGKIFGEKSLNALIVALKEIDAGRNWKKALSKLNN